MNEHRSYSVTWVDDLVVENERLTADIAKRHDAEVEQRKAYDRLSTEVKSAFEDGWNAHCDLFMEDHIEMEREEAWKTRDSGSQGHVDDVSKLPGIENPKGLLPDNSRPAPRWSKIQPGEQGWFWYRKSDRYHATPTFIEDCGGCSFRAVSVYEQSMIDVTDVDVEWWSERMFQPTAADSKQRSDDV